LTGPDDVDPESHVGQQLALVDALISGSLTADDLAERVSAANRLIDQLNR
jgi:hypothetical protein